MKHHQRLFFIIYICSCSISFNSFGQSIAELKEELAAVEAQLDSISIFSFLDSLLIASEPKSALMLSAGYANQVLINGQDFGLDQFGLNTNATYFHKSGAYGSYTGFYNSETSPNYYLNIVGLGYVGTLSPALSFNLGYEKSFFGGSNSTGLTNSLNASVSWVRKNFTTTLNYAFLFSGESANQVTPSVSYNLRLGKMGFLKSIDITPTFSVFWANSNILTASFDEDFLKEVWLLDQFDRFGPALLEQSGNVEGRERLLLLNRSVDVQKNRSFANLNQSLSIPVNLQFTDLLSLSVSYTYLFSNNLLLGNVVRDEAGTTAFVDTFRPAVRPRVSQFLGDLDEAIIFENDGNSGFINLTLSLFLQFQPKSN
ncbi:MAG: hypothetical protein AAFO69_19920 [Bacteroidota bacterium]